MNKEKFFSVVSLSDIDLSDATDIDIEMLRVGKFNHKKYGKLDIDVATLNTMVQNFDNNVVGRDISFDWNHKSEDASAWLKSVRVEDDKLIGTVDFTDKGADSVKNKRYGYFSIEYSDDHEDSESGDTFGPTILGGALTNRPFITKLQKIEFSLDGNKDVSLYRLEDNSMLVDKDGNKIVRQPVKTIVKEKEFVTDDDTKKQLAEFSDFIVAQKKQMEEMNGVIKTLQEENKSLKDANNNIQSRAKKVDVDRLCDTLLRDEHHHPAIVAIAKEIMLNDNGAKIIKMSETIKDGDNEKTVELELTVKDAVLRLLQAIPKNQRADYKEETHSHELSEEENSKLMDKAMANVFARKGLKVVKK